MKDKTLHVLCVAYDRTIELMNICGIFLVQTNPNWTLTIMYDGEPPEEIKGIMGFYSDKRITFTHSKERNGDWGHPNREYMLENLDCDDKDFVLLTNEDNLYVPVFVESMLGCTSNSTGLVYCDTLHNYIGYKVMVSELRENAIDMGSFIVRADVAKGIGFKHRNFSADGRYAEDCGKCCKDNGLEILHTEHPLFIHN